MQGAQSRAPSLDRFVQGGMLQEQQSQALGVRAHALQLCDLAVEAGREPERLLLSPG